MSTQPAINIEIRENGPLIVTGLKRLISAEGEAIEVKENIALCRCGESGNKPFCDGTHKRTGFSGAREIERPLNKSKAYVGQEITINDNRTICAHAAHCVEELGTVFNLEGRPWIDPNGASVQDIMALVRRCPSGALSYTIDGVTYDDFGSESQITIEQGGPYRVTGKITLGIDEILAPPASEHYTLCRCGISKNKPYCDGSHHSKESDWDR